jgi:hypothetical protein
MMNKELYMQILHGVREHDNYFVLKHDSVVWLVSHQFCHEDACI